MYVVVEGVDNVGKTTLIDQLKKPLEEYAKVMGVEVNYVAETEIPAYPFPDKFREINMALAYARQRADLQDEIYKDKDHITISDRSYISSYIYQDLPREITKYLNKDFKRPDLIIYLKALEGIYLDEDNNCFKYDKFMRETNIPVVTVYRNMPNHKTLEQILTYIGNLLTETVNCRLSPHYTLNINKLSWDSLELMTKLEHYLEQATSITKSPCLSSIHGFYTDYEIKAGRNEIEVNFYCPDD